MKEAEPANVSESYTGVINTKANAVQQDGALVVKKKKKKRLDCQQQYAEKCNRLLVKSSYKFVKECCWPNFTSVIQPPSNQHVSTASIEVQSHRDRLVSHAIYFDHFYMLKMTLV